MKILIVGSAGYWGSKLARVFRAEGHEIVAEINLPDDARSRSLIQARAWQSGAEAAVIATPAETHAVIAAAALDAGLDVLIEKPLALSVRHADTLRVLAKHHQRVLSVDSTFLHSPIFAWLRENGPWVQYQSLRMAEGPDRIMTPAGWDLMAHDVAILHGLGLLEFDKGHAVQSGDGRTAMAWLPFMDGEAFIAAGRAWAGRLRQVVLHHADGSEFVWGMDGHLRLLNNDLVVEQREEPLSWLVRDFADRCACRAWMHGLTDADHGVAVCRTLQHLFGEPQALKLKGAT